MNSGVNLRSILAEEFCQAQSTPPEIVHAAGALRYDLTVSPVPLRDAATSAAKQIPTFKQTSSVKSALHVGHFLAVSFLSFSLILFSPSIGFGIIDVAQYFGLQDTILHHRA